MSVSPSSHVQLLVVSHESLVAVIVELYKLTYD